MKTSLSHIKGLGPKRVDALSSLGLYTQEDFAQWVPLRYLDLSKPTPAILWKDGKWAVLKGIVSKKTMSSGKRSRFQMFVKVEHLEVSLTFFHYAKGVDSKVEEGDFVLFHGRLTQYGSQWQMVHPEWENLTQNGENDQAVRPLYSQPEALRSVKLDHKFLQRIAESCMANSTLQLPEVLPEQIKKDLHFISRHEVFQALHFPEKMKDVKRGRRQLKLEELLPISIRMAWRKQQMLTRGKSLCEKMNFEAEAIERFPFTLTESQNSALQMLFDGLRKPHQYAALVQGDVGSGKTAVAILSALGVLQSGLQVAVMAPTDILARQLFQAFQESLPEYSIGFLSASVSSQERKRVLDEIQTGEIACLIGTHSLLSHEVCFKNLSLVIVDEQHRFGVGQRTSLVQKGDAPDLINLSATPIPRSLVRSYYGDCESVVISSKPEGRKPVQTRLLSASKRKGLLKWAYDESAKKGNQVYWVVPRVQEEEQNKSVESLFQELTKTYPDWAIGKLFGKMGDENKYQTLEKFRQGELVALVSTTVIEVGVNVPEAGIIVIEGADCFGLAQLHQLRGRVGRGGQEAWCFLLSDKEDALERLTEFSQTEDGFSIAELDLKNRGTGNIEGFTQSGGKPFRYFDFLEDMELVLEMTQYSTDLFEKGYLKTPEGVGFLKSCLVEGDLIED